MLRFRIGEKVIVSDHGVKKLGIITGQATKQGNRVYNVKMENGVEHSFIRVNNPNASYYIDSEWSKKIGGSISTNLNENTSGNFSKTQSE
jgi:polynucleotide 5'-kinase involved in rRNA processing